MTILVAFAHTPEGRAALEHGRRLANSENTPLIVFDMDTAAVEDDGGITEPDFARAGNAVDGNAIRWLGHRREDSDPAAELIDVSEELSADLIVVGLRRRSRVGKLLLGSNAQRILIDAEVPVLAVKAAHHDD
ncbi:universal stress protein [Gordonia sp. KTR9]|uniref:universal stress protein n=1 Tax=Gordonia sp. KTR9 TaxID=337191 RepID=UPI00027DE209|nr:universal stress protein [Gordonia sp. KTR9]AFR51315.1 putative stress protein [Gordonia sp. KTR9]